MRRYWILLFVSVLAVRVTRAEVCDPGAFHGAYGFSMTGTTNIGGATRSVAVVGRMVLQDSGNLSGISSASFIGLVLGNRVTGKYEAHSDCSVTWTFQDPSGAFQHFAGTMSADGGQVNFRQADPGGPEDGIMLRTRDRCSVSSLAGTFDFTAAGSTVDVVTAAESGRVSLQGVLIPDGLGNLSFLSGKGQPAVPAGIYEVAGDCFVTLTLELPVDGKPTPATHFRAIVVDGGRGVLGMQIDPGAVVPLRMISE